MKGEDRDAARNESASERERREAHIIYEKEQEERLSREDEVYIVYSPYEEYLECLDAEEGMEDA